MALPSTDKLGRTDRAKAPVTRGLRVVLRLRLAGVEVLDRRLRLVGVENPCRALRLGGAGVRAAQVCAEHLARHPDPFGECLRADGRRGHVVTPFACRRFVHAHIIAHRRRVVKGAIKSILTTRAPLACCHHRQRNVSCQNGQRWTPPCPTPRVELTPASKRVRSEANALPKISITSKPRMQKGGTSCRARSTSLRPELPEGVLPRGNPGLRARVPRGLRAA